MQRTGHSCRKGVELFEEAGYDAAIVGGVAKNGWSDRKLDIFLSPKDTTCDCAKFTLIEDRLGGMDEDGRKVDFFFELTEESN